MSIAANSKTVVLSDFDGTICPAQVMDVLYMDYSKVGMQFAEKWERFEISTQEEIESTFASVSATKLEMESGLAEIRVDPHFSRFLEKCDGKDIQFAVVSDGFTWYIEYILNRHKIRPLETYANEIHFLNPGFRFEYPWFNESCPLRGVCKPVIVHQFQEQGAKVVYIGDGISDFEVAGVADTIYATGKLANYCADQRIPAIEFENFKDLIKLWPES